MFKRQRTILLFISVIALLTAANGYAQSVTEEDLYAETASSATQPQYSQRSSSQPRIGVGYQEIMGTEFKGVNVRVWADMWGVSGSFFQSSEDVEVANGADYDRDYLILEVRGYYPIIKLSQSKFYVGGLLGFGSVEVGSEDDSITAFGPLAGVEFHFKGLPELGIHWDISYTIMDGGDDRIGMDVLFGMAYYF